MSVTPLNPSPRTLVSRPPASVAVYMSSAPSGAVDIYAIRADGGPQERRLDAIRETAGELGCDGVVIDTQIMDAYSQGNVYDDRNRRVGSVQTSRQGYVSAVCVVMTSKHGRGLDD
jgi:hypothetical protein